MVSIIIPYFNNADVVGETLTSVYQQTYPYVEIIIVDDGSIRPFESLNIPTDLNTHVLRTPNRGVAEARNHGFAKSKGQYVLFLDSDDLLEPTALSLFVQRMKECPSIDFVYSDVQLFGEMNGRLRAASLTGLDYYSEFICNFICNTFLINRSAFSAVGGYSADFNQLPLEDWDLVLRLIRSDFSGAHINQPLVKYRIRLNSRNFSSGSDSLKLKREALKKIKMHRLSVNSTYIFLLVHTYLIAKQLILLRPFGPFNSVRIRDGIRFIIRRTIKYLRGNFPLSLA